jgi:hypothetical protein
MEYREQTFEILIDGQEIATEDLSKYKESRFYDISYLVSKELTKGKCTVTVKFVGKPKNQAGSVHGIRLVKEDRV